MAKLGMKSRVGRMMDGLMWDVRRLVVDRKGKQFQPTHIQTTSWKSVFLQSNPQ